MNETWRKYVPYGAVGLLIVALVFSGTRHDDPAEPIATESVEAQQPVSEESDFDEKEQTIIVEVKGAVHRPGIYEMKEGDRVDDAIRRAGGVTDEADERHVARAERVRDEATIYVPTIEENIPWTYEASPSSSSSERSEPIVSLNRSDANELQLIPGIGPKKAEAIIAYREEIGRFQTIEQLTDVPGIGEKTLESIRPYVEL